MKTERRQDLRTNELSEQLADIGEYVKRNAVALTIVVVAAAVLVVGGLAYARSQRNRLMDAWNQLNRADASTDVATLVERSQSVAAQNVDPSLTEAALLNVIALCLREEALSSPDDATDAAAAVAAPASAESTIDWAKTAKEAASQVVERFPDDPVAAGQAMLNLGILAENQGDFEQARSWYKKVIEDERIAGLPLHRQAQYRSAGVERWSIPVEFPPPLMTVPIPSETESSTPGAVSGQRPNIRPSAGPGAAAPSASPGPRPVQGPTGPRPMQGPPGTGSRAPAGQQNP